MVKVDIKLDMRQLQRKAREFPKQLAFATSRAINTTLLGAQQKALAEYHRAFTIRKEQFLKRSIKMMKFAKKNDLEATLGIADVSKTAHTKDILSKFEETGTKLPRRNYIAVPMPGVKRGKTGIISKGNRPKNLKNSFVLTSKKGKKLLLQRKGKGKRSTTNVMYHLDKSVRIKKRTDFVSQTVNHFNLTFDATFDKELAEAIRTAK